MLLLLAVMSAAPAAAAAPSPLDSRWELSFAGELGVPSGWVEVREFQIAGTRLDLHRDLGLSHAWTVEAGCRRRLGRRDALRLVIESHALDGEAILPGDVTFNGATLAGGTSLATRTHFPSFLRVTLTGERTLRGAGPARITAAAGITFVALTFKLQGTLAPTSQGSETQEDFVTQELPVPVLGIAVARPLTGRLDGEASILAGYLPRVNSLRHEGGTVRLRQRHLDLTLRLGWALAPGWRADLGVQRSAFSQNETSGEDGNDITFAAAGMRLGLTRRLGREAGG